jgi:hypothetical protein
MYQTFGGICHHILRVGPCTLKAKAVVSSNTFASVLELQGLLLLLVVVVVTGEKQPLDAAAANVPFVSLPRDR